MVASSGCMRQRVGANSGAGGKQWYLEVQEANCGGQAVVGVGKPVSAGLFTLKSAIVCTIVRSIPRF